MDILIKIYIFIKYLKFKIRVGLKLNIFKFLKF